MYKPVGGLILAFLLLAVVMYTVYDPQEEDSKTKLTVSAAASLTESFLQIEEEFEEAHPDIDVVLNLAGSGTLRMQIEGGAPIDVFASASQKHMDLLAESGLILNSTRSNFAGNSLVMIVPSGSGTNGVSMADLTSEEVGKVAMGDPDTAPVGKYTKEALEDAFLWDEISGKIVYAENVKQVIVYVEKAEVDAGFVYSSDYMAADKNRIEMAAEVPVNSSISYPIAVVSSSPEKEAAGKFIDFVLSQEGQTILEEHGFIVDGN
ncbi:molybdate transport system substrate-binding protein [Methanohalophilus levihalophilus]|uniref:molybdate ABC transporter substrate-binding protein n=1 Tax=Methanohalophilus levihalophilus TaxID=1431282 RepID=UPI001FDA1E15|nr:molybdate ABC transporter substrate-binding protein [Methanohalophilus levihalophilus]MBP2030658.1 molybdate transport system substrate-binding protein [Methanohalophilus levihalophilus]